MKKIIVGLGIISTSLSLTAQVRMNDGEKLINARNSSAFFDASSFNSWNVSPNLAKGIIFPRVDLTKFTSFLASPPVGSALNYPTYFDGFIVYNTATAGVPGVGALEAGITDLSAGFWYYDNKSTTLNGGTWKNLKAPQGLGSDINLYKDNGTLPAGTNRTVTLADASTSKLTIAPSTQEANISTLNVIGGAESGGATTGITISSNYRPNINKTATIRGLPYASANYPVQMMTLEASSSENVLNIGGNNSGSQANPTKIQFILDGDNNMTNNGTSTINAVTILGQSGNVGIGTTNPTEKLVVNGNSVIDKILTINGKDGGQKYVGTFNLGADGIGYGNSVDDRGLRFTTQSSSAGNQHVGSITAGDTAAGNSIIGERYMKFNVKSNDNFGDTGFILRSYSSGETRRVGIGTNDPSQKLDVNGTLKATHLTNGTAAIPVADFGLYNQTNNWLRIATPPTTSIAFLADASASNNFAGSSTTMVVRGSNVGIGTISPSARLHIYKPSNSTEKSFRLEDGTQAQGNILVSDNSGNASWEPSPFRETILGTLNTTTQYVATNLNTGSSITLARGKWLINVGQLVTSYLPGTTDDNMWMRMTLSSSSSAGQTTGFRYLTNSTLVSGWFAPAKAGGATGGAYSMLAGVIPVEVTATTATLYLRFGICEKTPNYQSVQYATINNSGENYLFALPLQ